jgi:hypothetical protein
MRYSPEIMNEEQLECLQLSEKINCSIEKRKGFYVLVSDDRKYRLP